MEIADVFCKERFIIILKTQKEDFCLIGIMDNKKYIATEKLLMSLIERGCITLWIEQIKEFPVGKLKMNKNIEKLLGNKVFAELIKLK